MSMIIDGTNGLTFNDSTTQTKAALVVGTASAITAGTSVASTSGTSIDFTGIPSWVKRVTVMFSGVSTNGTSPYIIQLGTSGGFQTSSYLGSVTRESTSGGANFSSGFQITGAVGNPSVLQGNVFLLNQTGNTWTESGQLAYTDAVATAQGSGYVSLSGALTQIRIRAVNGTDTFDAGSINIFYE